MISVDESVVSMIGSWNDETYDGGQLAVNVIGISLSSDSGCDLGFCCPSACLCSILSGVLKLKTVTFLVHLPYNGFAAIGTALLQPTRSTDPPQSKPSNSRRAVSASFLFIKETNPLRPAFLVLRVVVMSAPGPTVPSVRGHIIFTWEF